MTKFFAATSVLTLGIATAAFADAPAKIDVLTTYAHIAEAKYDDNTPAGADKESEKA